MHIISYYIPCIICIMYTVLYVLYIYVYICVYVYTLMHDTCIRIPYPIHFWQRCRIWNRAPQNSQLIPVDHQSVPMIQWHSMTTFMVFLMVNISSIFKQLPSAISWISIPNPTKIDFGAEITADNWLLVCLIYHIMLDKEKKHVFPKTEIHWMV